MRKIILILSALIFSFLFSRGQSSTTIKKDKLLSIRSNSRDITPVRRTNLHARPAYRKLHAIGSEKRGQLRKKQAIMIKNRALQNKNRIMQQKQMMKKKAIHKRRR